MGTEHLKAQIHKGTEKIEHGIESAAEKLANAAEAPGCKHASGTDDFGDVGKCFRESAKCVSRELEKQARLHPLATFGVAFAAGLIVARTLRR